MSTLTTARPVKTLKAVLVGESTVGKTSILTVANTGQFDQDAASTVGACFVANNYAFAERAVRLNLWDTAGQERYRALAPMYYRDMDIGCIVYAIDNRQSFDCVELWYDSIMNELSNRPQLYLLANKRDLEARREVSEMAGTELAKKLGAEFFEVSALADGKGVITLFENMAQRAAEEVAATPKQSASLTEATKREKRDCC
jgi:small GTP-binding protein